MKETKLHGKDAEGRDGSNKNTPMKKVIRKGGNQGKLFQGRKTSCDDEEQINTMKSASIEQGLSIANRREKRVPKKQ